MQHWQRIALLILCASFCRQQFYLGGFERKNDPENCYCFERLPKSTPVPLPITLFYRPFPEAYTPWSEEDE